jgi:hypothetical protein
MIFVASENPTRKPSIRAPHPYAIFCHEKTPGLKAAHPNATADEIFRMLGVVWSSMDIKAKMLGPDMFNLYPLSPSH